MSPAPRPRAPLALLPRYSPSPHKQRLKIDKRCLSITMPLDTQGSQFWEQKKRPTMETDSAPLDTGVPLDTFFRHDADGHHFESSYPVESKDGAGFESAWAGAAPFRRNEMAHLADIGPLSCLASRKKSEQRKGQETSHAVAYADARTPGPHPPYSAPAADDGPRPALIIGLDGSEVLQSDTTVQPDGTVVGADGQPIGKV